MISKYILFWAKLHSVKFRLYVFMYVGSAGHFWGATAPRYFALVSCAQLGAHHWILKPVNFLMFDSRRAEER